MNAGWSIELLPVFVAADGGIRWLLPSSGTAWHVPAQLGQTPEDITLNALRVFGVGPFVAHSTSWRFLAESSTLVLTYLVLLPTLHGSPPPRFVVHEAQREALARGDLTAPPPTIGVEQVLEHALRHLAWLAGDDPAIRSLLGERWLTALAPYQPEPFRSIQQVFIAAPGLS